MLVLVKKKNKKKNDFKHLYNTYFRIKIFE